VAHGRKQDLEQPVVAAQAVVPLQAQAVVPLRVQGLVPLRVQGLELQLVELQQEVLRRLARQLQVLLLPVWL
jgi:hypothetical protein